METKDWFLFLGPLAGVIIGGMITSIAKVIESKYARKIAKQDAQLKKLEDIADVLGSIMIASTLWAYKLKHAIQAGDKAEAHQVLSDSTSLCTGVTTQISIYLPTLRTQAEGMLAKASSFMTAGDEKIYASLDKKCVMELEKLDEQYMDEARAFIGAISELKSQVQKEIQALTY